MTQKNTPRQRLDVELVRRKLVASRSQAESYIKLGRVKVNQRPITKPGMPIKADDDIKLEGAQYVSRAAFKLASVSEKFDLDFGGKTVLDVGSSTGGFTDYALRHGAKKVIAVDVGTDQLHPSLHGDKRIELHEKTDIRDFKTKQQIDMVVIDVSFISLWQILPSISQLLPPDSQIIAMVKPQFEAGDLAKHKGVIKNDTIRRKILKDFEIWAKQSFVIQDKADAEVTGAKGNRERFYLLIVPNHE
jgi:23S rRNA (cytidine1920-2'-O)/16S rRNA (cytidine1409-2'-O)-methyltransferase